MTHLEASQKWRFWIDRGGTFTDIVARGPDGSLLTKKLLSENPENYDDAALEGMRQFLGAPQNTLLPSHKIHSVKMGTTVATNALLERRGETTLLAITAGLRDVLEIGTQARDDIFALNILKPSPLYQDLIEVDERLSASGDIITPLDVEKYGRICKPPTTRVTAHWPLCCYMLIQTPSMNYKSHRSLAKSASRKRPYRMKPVP